MQRKNLEIGALLALVAFSAIVFLLYQQQQAQPLEQDYEKEFQDLQFVEEELTPVAGDSILQGCAALKTQSEKDMCFAFEAMNQLDPEICLQVAEKPAKINCLRAVAVDFESDSAKEKAANCETNFAENYDGLVECLDALQSQIKQEKLGICNKYFAGDQTQKYMCHSEIARNLGDLTICDPMPQNFKDHCTKMVQSEA